MDIIRSITIIFVFGLFFVSCEKDDEALKSGLDNSKNTDADEVSEIEVEEFIYKGMNDIYLYKADVPELEDSHFSSDKIKEEYLTAFDSPEDLFDALTASQDRFSFLTDNYVELEDSFDGVSSSTAGMKFGLGRISGTTNIFAFLQYVLPETSAAEAGLTRGTIFTEVDGQKMTLENYTDLLDADSFTINIGKVENGSITLTEKTVTLNSDKYTANPVLIKKVLTVEDRKIGYLMYNSFIADFDDKLNDAFSYFKSQGIQDFVLDLRYNAGGSVESAVDLASMITGQFEGKIFMKEQWNEDYQKYLEAESPEKIMNRFDTRIRTEEQINSLNLSKVYVLTSASTASASELVINGLAPWIDVIQVGERTTGKFQASVTLYDSPDFTREDANGREHVNPRHTYAIQPLVFKSANAAGKSDYVNGLLPDVTYEEEIINLGVLGEPSEPLLKAAINHILGKPQDTKRSIYKSDERFEIIGGNVIHERNHQKMYIDEIPTLPKQFRK